MLDHLPKNRINTLRTDIKDMYELDPEDRYSFVRSVMAGDELYTLPLLTDTTGITCHYIHDIKTAQGEGSTETNPADVFYTDDHLFTRLKQCEILEVDTTKYRPYLRANLSECSVIIARDTNRLWAAHLGMSQISQLNHALEQLHRAGFSEEDCRVIASVGNIQEANNEAGYTPRLTSKQAYIDRGFKPDSISTFEYIPPTSPDNRMHHNFCELTIGKDGELMTTFDAEMYFRHGMAHEEVDQKTVQELFTASQITESQTTLPAS